MIIMKKYELKLWGLLMKAEDKKKYKVSARMVTVDGLGNCNDVCPLDKVYSRNEVFKMIRGIDIIGVVGKENVA